MRDKVKRFISILMTALMLVNLLPVGALADGITSGGYQQATIANGNQTVYLYVKVTGNLNGLNLNKSGWCTVGKVTGLDMTDPQTYAWWYGSSNHVSSVSGISASSVGTGNEGNLTRYEKNQSIDLSKVTWSSGTSYGFLPVSTGADDYVGAGWTWHLDGYIDIAQVKASYKIRYVDQDTGKVLKIAASGTDDPGVWIDHSAPKKLDGGYEIVGDTDRTFKLEQIDNTFDIYYRRQYGYKVEYYYDGVKDDKKTETGSAWCKDVIRQYTDKPEVGYEFEKTKNLPLTIQADESKNVIKVYYKKIGYTVTYAPGEHGAFTAKAYNAKHGDATPAFDGETTGKPGWTFDGLDPAVADTVTGNVTYTAKFVPDKTKTATVLYTISIGQSDYGSIAPSAQQIILQATGKLDSDVGGSVSGSTATAKPGYKFAGWYKATGEATYEWVTDDPKLTSELAESELNRDEKTGLYQNTVFEARFEPDEKQTATVTYTAENGTVTHASDTILQADASGLTGSTALANTGYKFDGWYNGDEFVTDDLTLTPETAKPKLNKNGNLYAATTFTAKFVPDTKQSAKVIYTTDGNGTLWGGPAIEKTTQHVQIVTGEVVREDGSVIGDKLTTIPTYPKDGYEFDRWIRVTPEKTIEGAGSALTDEMARPNLNQADDGLYQETEFKAIFKPRTDLSYTVNYYWNGTETPVLTSKPISGKMFGEEVTESPVGVEGYTPVSTESQTITLGTGTNEINFYYYKNVELTADSRTLTYDGYEHGVSGYGCSVEGLTFEGITVEAMGKDAGEYPAAFERNETKPGYPLNKVDTTEKYIVTDATDGKLVIEKRKVTLTSEGGSKVYDGAPLTKPEVQIEGSFVDGEVLGIVAQGTVTDVSEGEVTNTIFFNRSPDFKDSNYNIVQNEGKLWITPRQVTLTSETASKPYDGTELKKPDVQIEGSFVEGEVTDIKATGKVTHVSEGEVTNTITFKKSEKFKESNYNIIKTEGKLSITQAETEVVVKIAGDTAIVPYDGKKHTVERWTVTSITETEPQYDASNIGFEGTAIAEGTDAGTYVMGLKDTQFKNTNGNFKNVTFVVEDGQLEIKKREVTLTSETASKPYDGTALTKPVVAVTGDGFVEGEVSDVKATGSVTNVSEGEVLNPISVTPGEKFKAKNYSITKNEGKLSITPITDKVTVTITENFGTVTYDGTEHKVEGYKSMTADNTLYNVATSVQEKPTEAWTAKGTNVGEYPVGIVAGDFKNINGNFSNVEFVVEDGILTISKRSVKLTSEGGSKVYDGTALTKPEVTVGGDGFVEGEVSDVKAIGSVTHVSEGEVTNTITYTEGENFKADNYTIEKDEGELWITPVTDKVTVTIKGGKSSVTYNGEDHTVTGYKVADISNPLYKEANFTFSGKAEANGKNAGIYKMGLKAADFANTSNNFTNVEFVVADGQLEITKRPVMLTSADLIKVYDGTPLTNGDTPVKEEFGTEDAFPEGEGVTYTFKGSQTNAGSSKNMFTYAWNEGANKDNYTIYQVEGDLVVTPIDGIKVTITGHKDTRTYDGKEHFVFGFDAEPSNALYNPKEDMQFNGTDVDMIAKGTDAGQYDIGLTAEHFTNKSDNFTNVTFVVTDGYVKINPRAVTLTSETAGKTYDGTALEKPVVTVGGDGFVEGQVKEIKATGSVTNAGSVANTITFTPDKETFKEGNYAITKNEGTLTIAKRSVLLTSQSATKTYDGSALTRPAVTITGDGFVPGELAKVEATGSITNVGSTPNAIQYTTTGAFNPANYSIALSVGTLTVTAKPEPEPRRTFNLTVNYVYQNGKRAAASYNRGGLKNGETFDITSPVIAGYTASETVVSGTIYNRDIKVTVIYTADGVNLDDYGVPLGLGNITMNVGDCFE